MNKKSKRELLTEELLRVKKEGLRVFINEPDEYNYYNYGLMTDGTNIIYVQFGEYGSCLFVTSFEWIPSRENGSGCQTIKGGMGYEHLSKDVFDDAVKYGKRFAKKCHAECYKSFEQFYSSDKTRSQRYKEM